MFNRKTILFLSAATCIASASATAQVSFQNAVQIPLHGQRPDWVAKGDFDGDDDVDIAVSTGQLSGVNGPEWVEIFHNTGNGSLTAGQVILMGNDLGTGAIVAADFDTDGDLDLAVTLQNVDTVRILTNVGGTFSLGGTVVVGGVEPRHMACGDIDSDGDVDLVASNRASSTVQVLVNNGLGAFTPGVILAVGVDPRHVVVDDLNGDCDLDIAVAVSDSRRIDVLFNNGTGGFSAIQSLPVPGNEKPSGLVAADIDNDGDVDLASTTDNGGLGQFVVFTNNAGTFAAMTFASNGINPDAMLAVDLDADGNKDLLATDEDANLVSTVRNVGGTNFGAASTFAVGTHPTSVAGTDLDGNGSIDLIVANRDSDNLSVLRNATTGGTETYCIGQRNSVGAGARIDTFGSMSITANTFTLTVRCAPAVHNGMFFYGATSTNVPFGGGRLCVQQPIARLAPVLQTNGIGRLVSLLDFTQAPVSSGPAQVLAGSTWFFQFWYRDQFAGAHANRSDALRATFNL